MRPRTICVMAFTAITSAAFLPNAAEAGSRWRLQYLNPYYYIYHPRPHDLYSSDYGDDEDDYDDPYYEPEYGGADDEPVYIAPRKKKTVKAVPITKPPLKKTVASVDTNTVVTVEKKTFASVEKKAVSGTAGMTCDKAEKIVSGYGFTSVIPTSCTGQIFAFNATRSGKAYVIKLSSASGELTEVKKVQ